MAVDLTSEPFLFVKLGKPMADVDRALPRDRYGYDPSYSEEELRNSARAWWALDPRRAATCRFLVATDAVEIVGVWEIEPGSWRNGDGRRFGKTPIRWACSVRSAPDEVHRAMVHRPIPSRSNGRPMFGSGSVIAYLNA